MPVDKQEFETMIKEQIDEEKKAVSLLRDSMKKSSNMIVQLMLNQLALDSAKHVTMLRAILQLLESPSPERLKHESQGFRKIMEEHVEIERKMLEDFEKIVDESDDSRIRFILQDMISDEKKHHAIMKRVHELVHEGDEVQDQKWWDFLFRYSRLTG